MKLTKREVDAARYNGADGGRDVRWDDEVPGFGLRVYPTGKKAFVLSYRTAGRKRLMTLGAYGALTVDEARKLARKHLAAIESGNSDPLGDRQQEARGETVADLAAAYLERHASRKRSGDDDKRRIERHLLPAWGNLKAAAIKRADLASLHSKIGRTAPYEANRVAALV